MTRPAFHTANPAPGCLGALGCPTRHPTGTHQGPHCEESGLVLLRPASDTEIYLTFKIDSTSIQRLLITTVPTSPASPPPPPQHLHTLSLVQGSLGWPRWRAHGVRMPHLHVNLVSGSGVQKWGAPPLQALLTIQTHPVQTEKPTTPVSLPYHPKFRNHRRSESVRLPYAPLCPSFLCGLLWPIGC